MKPRLHKFIVVVALAWSQASAVMAQELRFSHGAAEGGQIITNYSQIHIFASTAHTQLPSSALTVQLQPGDSDLFVLQFDAECFVGPTGHLSVQARLNGAVGTFVSALQPQDLVPDLHACTSGTFSRTISKSWAVRLSNTTSSPRTYTFSLWVRSVDLSSEGDGVVSILNDRIVRYTRYN